ncbi:uroporphyrinogen-III C-methyltransferase [Salmonella enterica subsp. enterica serovar Choleraesuis]|nr:uroporphyrinogen-III C-methyltransferase [Salmonella enterica subsp. enterica serovar Choleraesuis]
MTEQQKETSAMVEQSSADVETTAQPNKSANKNLSPKAGIALGAIAIVIALAAGGGLYSLNKHQSTAQSATSQELAERLSALQQQQDKQQSALEDTIKQQASALDAAKAQQAQTDKALSELQQKVATITGSDSNTWLLSQADFLVKQAGRKLWSDNDVMTAAALLKSADASLADMDDPSLISARRTISEDIASLAAITQIDYDGIILKVNQLTNQVDNLRLADNDDNSTPMDDDSQQVSGTLSNWRANLSSSWHNFMDNFISIRRRDASDVPLLAPNQDVYLRENIRSRLLVAAQAVPRHQQEIYKQSLENVAAWVRAYYDTDDASTRAFLESLDNLEQQDITMTLPDSLKSQPVLDKLMQTRVRNMMTSSLPVVTPTPASPAAPANPEPAAPPAAPETAPQAAQGE